MSHKTKSKKHQQQTPQATVETQVTLETNVQPVDYLKPQIGGAGYQIERKKFGPRVHRDLDPKIKEAIEHLNQNEPFNYPAEATEDEIVNFFDKMLTLNTGQEVTAHQLFLFGFLRSVPESELIPVVVDGKFKAGFDTVSLHRCFTAVDTEGNQVLNIYCDPTNFTAFEKLATDEKIKAVMDGYPYRLHLYQEWMGVWGKRSNQRYWLGFLNSQQRVGGTKEKPKFNLEFCWMSESLLNSLNKERDGINYRDRIIAKGKELGITN
jgi:hypothetical protein